MHVQRAQREKRRIDFARSGSGPRESSSPNVAPPRRVLRNAVMLTLLQYLGVRNDDNGDPEQQGKDGGE